MCMCVRLSMLSQPNPLMYGNITMSCDIIKWHQLEVIEWRQSGERTLKCTMREVCHREVCQRRGIFIETGLISHDISWCSCAHWLTFRIGYSLATGQLHQFGTALCAQAAYGPYLTNPIIPTFPPWNPTIPKWPSKIKPRNSPTCFHVRKLSLKISGSGLMNNIFHLPSTLNSEE